MAAAAVIRVGPQAAVQRIAEAARIAHDGDRVEIAAGTYRGDVAVWHQDDLTIVGLGDGVTLDAHGRSAEGKAIWVFRGGRVRIENITFRNTRVAGRNGAGIRFERGTLEVRRCTFEHNQMGLLTSNDPTAVLKIRDSRFAAAPHQTDSLPHLLYAGRIARLEVIGSHFSGGYAGHLIKSRARQTELRYNFLVDGPGGQASYEVDLPNGGRALLLGNVIAQSPQTQNTTVVAYGAEGPAWPDNDLTLVHNTLVSEAVPGAWFLRTWDDKLPDARIAAVNNLTVGVGLFEWTNPGHFVGNYPALSGMLVDPDHQNFRLRADALPAGRVPRADETTPGLTPDAEFRPPAGVRPIRAPHRWSPGALQPGY